MKFRFTRSGARLPAGSASVVKRFFARLAADALSFHQACDLVTADVDAGLTNGDGHLAAAVHRVVLLPDRPDLRAHLSVADLAGAGLAGLGGPVGGGGDLQRFTDRLDPPSQPTGLTGPVGVDELNNRSDLI